MVKPTLIFDLDDTLIDSTTAYKSALETNSLALDLEVYRNARAFVKNRLQHNPVSAHNRLLYFKTYLELKNEFSPARLIELVTRYETRLTEIFREQWRTLDRESLMNDLAKKFDFVVVTNENLRTQIIKLNAIDPHGTYFSRVLTSEEIGDEKPSDRIVHELSRHFNLDLRSSWAIGDQPSTDLEPLVAEGVKTICTGEFGSRQNERRELCATKHHYIQHLDELRFVLLNDFE